MTTLLHRLVAVLERGVDSLERIAVAVESIAAMSVFHESGHDPELPLLERNRAAQQAGGH